jgi:hypothetical protein
MQILRTYCQGIITFRNKDLGVKNDTDSVLVSLFVDPAPVAIVRSSRCKRAPKLRA